MKNSSGFTLIELMVTLVIVIILAVLAIPAYQQYITNAKMAEAYNGMDAIIKKELVYYTDNNEFYGLGHNPATMDQPMTITNVSGWDPNWYPTTPGNKVNFSYAAFHGQVDGSGAEVATSPNTGYNFDTISGVTTIIRRTYISGSRCNPSTAPSTYGVTSQPNYNWLIVSAVADLTGDPGSNCTGIVKLTEVKSGTIGSAGGFIVINQGE
jgi:prepilin-type N-terminal cleavage/methylation domain-containing protein